MAAPVPTTTVRPCWKKLPSLLGATTATARGGHLVLWVELRVGFVFLLDDVQVLVGGYAVGPTMLNVALSDAIKSC